MGKLTGTQKTEVVSYFSAASYGDTVANFTTTDITAAITAIDNALDTTLSAAVAALGGSITVINGMAAAIPAPFSSATQAEKALLCCHVVMKRTGII